MYNIITNGSWVDLHTDEAFRRKGDGFVSWKDVQLFADGQTCGRIAAYNALDGVWAGVQHYCFDSQACRLKHQFYRLTWSDEVSKHCRIVKNVLDCCIVVCQETSISSRCIHPKRRLAWAQDGVWCALCTLHRSYPGHYRTQHPGRLRACAVKLLSLWRYEHVETMYATTC